MMKCFQQGMLCPFCEIGILEEYQEDIEFEYKGEKTILQSQKVFRCQECEESFLDPKDEREREKCLTNSRRRVDHLLTTDEIKTIRLQFQMTQVEFSHVLRVGEKTFARYENGQATQGYAMDNLLRILREYPHVLHVISDVQRQQEFYRGDNIIPFPYATTSDEQFVTKHEHDQLDNLVLFRFSDKRPVSHVDAACGM
jgi:putative zinc finger/helix-turn-helix YgiT family protein